MKKNLRLIVIDELGDEYCHEAFTVPTPSELTREEVEAYKGMLLSCRVEIYEEARGYYWIEDFKCKTDYEEEEAEREKLFEEFLEEFDGDEDAAWEAVTDYYDGERYGDMW